MLTIKAKENSKIEVVNGDFPIGMRDTIKIIFEDNILKGLIKTTGTKECKPEHNMFSYGEFNNSYDIDKVSFDLRWKSTVSIVNGKGCNYSRCLFCHSTGKGFRKCEIKADRGKLEAKNKYMFSCDILAEQKTNAQLELTGIHTFDILADGNWHHIFYEFEPQEDMEFMINVLIPQAGDLYIDNVKIFNSKYEIMSNYYESMEVSLNVLNPCQYPVNRINRIINFSKPEEEDAYVLLYYPPITNVDALSNILVKLEVAIIREPEDVYLGNTTYFKIRDVIYTSECFCLSGYIVPPDYDRYELVVGEV